MLRKLKKWLVERFLPMWAKETILEDNKKLLDEIAKLRRQLDKKDAYIEGLEAGVKAQRRIVINNGEGKK